MTIANSGTPVEKLWQDYLFLTREMLKFVEKPNLEMFYELLAQRQAVQEQLEKMGKTEKGEAKDQNEAEWQKMLVEVQNSNRQMINKLKMAQNRLKQGRERAFAYEGIIVETLRGHRGDWST